MRRPLGAAGAVSLVVALTFAVTGCGSSSSSETTTAGSELATWAGGFCTAVGKFKASIAATRATLHVRQLSRPAVQVAVQEVSAARRQLANELEQLGPPPIEAVDETKRVLNDLRVGLRKQADKARSVLTNASSTGDVRQAASNISDALTAATDEASQAFGELRKLDPKGEAEQAFESAPCSSL
jgi:methyl-accepting chemotaxis protein